MVSIESKVSRVERRGWNDTKKLDIYPDSARRTRLVVRSQFRTGRPKRQQGFEQGPASLESIGTSPGGGFGPIGGGSSVDDDERGRHHYYESTDAGRLEKSGRLPRKVTNNDPCRSQSSQTSYSVATDQGFHRAAIGRKKPERTEKTESTRDRRLTHNLKLNVSLIYRQTRIPSVCGST